MKNELIKAKVALYNAILRIPPLKIAAADMDLAVLLVKDPGIQKLLEARRKGKWRGP